MQSRGRRRFVGLLVVAVLIFGLTLGATVGGMAGFFLAERWGSPAAVTVAQPAPTDEVALPESEPVPAAPIEEAPTEVPALEAPTPAPSGEPIVDAVAHVQPATVRVLTNAGSGSGFIVSEDGYIVTNSHVVEGARQIAVDYMRGERIPATLVGRSPEFDLAVLKVDEPVPAVVPWGDSSAVPLGGQVIAIGSALGEYQNSVTVGILSGVNRQLGNMFGLLQTDAAINYGNSGGPLVNREGEVIGINTMVLRGGGSNAEGLGFAIPSNIARSIVQQLIDNGVAERPFMGVSLLALNSQNAQELGVSATEGAYIEAVTPNSPSAQAGIEPGDVIVAIDGKPVTDRDPLPMLVLSHAPGETVTVSVLRGDRTVELALTLVAMGA